MDNKTPVERHRETAQKVINTPHYAWHDRQSRLHTLVITHGYDAVTTYTGFTASTIRVYLSYKPHELGPDSNIINESRLIKAEKALQK